LDQWRIHAGADLDRIVKRSVVVIRHNVEPIERLGALLQPLKERARVVVIGLRQPGGNNGGSRHRQQKAGPGRRAELLHEGEEVGEIIWIPAATYIAGVFPVDVDAVKTVFLCIGDR